MKRPLALTAILAFSLPASGCVYALHPFSRETSVKLRVDAPQDRPHSVVLLAVPKPKEFPLSADGTVTFTVPPFRGCTVYLFGFVKIRDGTPERDPIVQVLSAKRVVLKLSLAELAELPQDEAGYRVVRVTR